MKGAKVKLYDPYGMGYTRATLINPAVSYLAISNKYLKLILVLIVF